MTRTRKSKAKKSSTQSSTNQPSIDYRDIKRGLEHLKTIETTCRNIEAQLRQQSQNPLEEILQYLNLAEPRLSEKVIDKVIRPYFYFGYAHKQISNQKAFQDAVLARLTNPDAAFIFEKMIRTYFQALDLRIDGRNGNKSHEIAIGPASTQNPPTRFPVHGLFHWSKLGTSAVHIAQVITWKNCTFFISYGRLSPTIITPFKRSLRKHAHLPYREFLSIAEPQYIMRFADPFDRHRRDQYLKKNTPTPQKALEHFANDIFQKELSCPIQRLVEFSANQQNATDINALNQAIIHSHNKIICHKLSYFPTIAQNISLNLLQKTLYTEPNQATEHINALQQHPLKNLLLDNQTLIAANLSKNDPIQQILSLDLPAPHHNIIKNAWITYVTEQRLAAILSNAQQTPLFNAISPFSSAIRLADIRFQNTQIGDILIEKRYQNTLLKFIKDYIFDNLLCLDSFNIHDITLAELLKAPPYHYPLDFNQLAKVTRKHFNEAIIQHLANWRLTLSPPQSAPQISTHNALNALQEINDLFNT